MVKSTDTKLNKMFRRFISLSFLYLIILTIGFWVYGEIAPDNIGQVGDFFGGLVNPLFGFFTVVLLVWSIHTQIEELKITRDEFKNSVEAQQDSAIAQDNLFKSSQNSFKIENIIHGVNELFIQTESITKYWVSETSSKFSISDTMETNKTLYSFIISDFINGKEITSPVGKKHIPEQTKSTFKEFSQSMTYSTLLLTELVELGAWARIAPLTNKYCDYSTILFLSAEHDLVNDADISIFHMFYKHLLITLETKLDDVNMELFDKTICQITIDVLAKIPTPVISETIKKP